MLKNFLLVGIGGMAGSMLRYGANIVFRGSGFPWATFTVNVVGSFVIGLVAGFALKSVLFENNWRLFLATGICGGFTTFSALSLEGVQMLQQQRYTNFLLYFALSIVLGLAATWAGFAISR